MQVECFSNNREFRRSNCALTDAITNMMLRLVNNIKMVLKIALQLILSLDSEKRSTDANIVSFCARFHGSETCPLTGAVGVELSTGLISPSHIEGF